MKRKITTIILALALCATLAVPALAAEDGDLVYLGIVWDGGLETATGITGINIELSDNLDTFDFDELSEIVLHINGEETDAELLPDYDPYVGTGITGAENHYRKYNESANKTQFSFYFAQTQTTHPAEYVLTCLYRGQQWRSITMTWNANGTFEFDYNTFGAVVAEQPAPEVVAVPEAPPPAALIARPTASAVLVNSKNVEFDAYNIEGNNYFKLRDLAYVLGGTEKQFSVGWDSANNAITLTSGEPYTPNGSEMVGKGDGNKTPTATTATIYLDGEEVSFTAYNIDGNNYFKLRDIGLAFDFGVTWDGEKSTIVIDTSVGYTPE